MKMAQPFAGRDTVDSAPCRIRFAVGTGHKKPTKPSLFAFYQTKIFKRW